jgi:hypothetical protein
MNSFVELIFTFMGILLTATAGIWLYDYLWNQEE